MKIVSAKIFCIVLLGVIAAAQAGSLDRPVMIGSEADYDACGATGDAQNLNPAGDNFLAVLRVVIDGFRAGDGSVC